MSKEVDLGKTDGRFDTVYINIKDWNEIQKQLKALEIIKEKIGLHWNEILRIWLRSKLITQEEYDLLKEVLL